jgi:hypothetical protein
VRQGTENLPTERNERNMARYKITAQYNYEGIVEAPTQERAERLFENDLNSHYESPESFEVTELCPDCDSEDELDLDGSCFDCRENEEEN